MSDAALTSDSVVRPGVVIDGKFSVDHVIGEGGMGVVVAATHLQLGERVALKFLRKDAMKNEEVVARFAQEARAAVRLKSQYVARVLDVGRWEDMPFMVMEYLEGQDLGHVLAGNGPLPIEEAVEYIIQACEGLAEAHARGIVHRDVKPENIFLTEHDGWKSIKLLDFGISKAALTGVGSEISLVKTSSIMGSPCYMSPEQLRSTKNVDHRADIWSLGAVLFELLAGRTPYDANVSLTELVAMVLEEPPGNLRGFRPDVPPALEEAVLRCLEKDPAKRFQSAAQVAIALLPFGPRRARLAAERAISLTRAAGLSDGDLKLPPSIFPSAGPSGQSSGNPAELVSRSGVRLAVPLLPNEYRHSSPNQATGSALPVDASPPSSKKKLVPLLLGAIGVLLVVAIGLAFRLRGSDHDAHPASSASVAVATSATAPPKEEPPRASAELATEAPAASASTAASAAPASAAAPSKTPLHVARPKASAAATGTPDLDIRMTR